jgi:TolB protein
MRSTVTPLHAALVLCAMFSSTAHSQNYPLKRLPSFTYLVDYEASWSPDGTHIVLISSRHGGLKVHVLAASDTSGGNDMHQLTTGPDEDDAPVWSPDGKHIAFVSIHDSISDIFVMDSNGANVRQVTHALGQNIHPAWSPDGTRILFNTTFFAHAIPDAANAQDSHRVIGEARDDSIELATIKPDGSDLRRITHGGGFTYASFSPDGSAIVHRKQHGDHSQVFVMNADGSADHQLSGAAETDGWPAWSPDGKRIVFSRHTATGFQIFVMNRDGSGAHQLTDAAGEFVNPRWSPDGRKILCGRRLGGISLIVFDAPQSG